MTCPVNGSEGLRVRGINALVDTGFEPVTSSVSEDTFATTRSAGSAERSRMNRQASTTCVG
jgi:hypothetical protein